MADERRPLTPSQPPKRRPGLQAQDADDDASCFDSVYLNTFRACVGVLLCVGGVGAFFSALPVVISTLPDMQVAQALGGYETDFELANANCSVERIKECWHTTVDSQPPDIPLEARDLQDGTTSCWTSYTIRFKPPHATRYTRTIQEWPDYVFQNDTNCSALAAFGYRSGGCFFHDAMRTPSGRFTSGGEYPCWKAAAQGIDPRYQCGNLGQCFKLKNPADIAEVAIKGARRGFALGGSLGGGGILVLCLSLLCCSGGAFTRATSRIPDVPVEPPPPEMIVTKSRRWDSQPPPEVDGLKERASAGAPTSSRTRPAPQRQREDRPVEALAQRV
jgi:hypothetical protein